MKKQLKLIIIVAIVTAVILALWWGVSLIPNDNDGVSSVVSQAVDLYEVDRGNVAKIEVKNALDEFCVNNTESAFTVEGLDEYPLYTSRVSSIVSAISDVTARRLVEENAEDLEKYGLSSPSVEATLYSKNGTTYTLSIGDEAPSGGYYFLYNNSNNVYIISTVSAESLMYERLDLVDVVVAPTIEEIGGELIFDTITLSGTVRNEPIEIINVDNGDSEEIVFFAYEITKPGHANFDSTNGNIFLNGLISGYAEKAEVLSPSEEDLENYGFNNPYSMLTLNTKGKEFKVIVGKVDGDYAFVMRPDRNIIYKASVHAFSWLETQYVDLVDKLFLMPYIAEVNLVQVSFPDQSFDFNVDYSDQTDLTATYKGKTLKRDVFKQFYQVLVNAYYENYTTEEPTGECVMSLVYNYKNGKVDKLELFKSKENPRQVIIVLNGEKTNFSMRYNFVDKVKGDCQNVLDSKEIVTDW